MKSTRLMSISATLALSMFVSISGAADLKLSGDNEVPPVRTMASGSGTIQIADDGSVTGSVKTTGVEGVAAHIHVGSTGKNGPVIIPLQRVPTVNGPCHPTPSSMRSK